MVPPSFVPRVRLPHGCVWCGQGSPCGTAVLERPARSVMGEGGPPPQGHPRFPYALPGRRVRRA
ncbi:hypothetical protein T261_05840 [Streptomyces lydicus]|nr:hypothetical protein T261_05840 [Streptomyces lydicus]